MKNVQLRVYKKSVFQELLSLFNQDIFEKFDEEILGHLHHGHDQAFYAAKAFESAIKKAGLTTLSEVTAHTLNVYGNDFAVFAFQTDATNEVSQYSISFGAEVKS